MKSNITDLELAAAHRAAVAANVIDAVTAHRLEQRRKLAAERDAAQSRVIESPGPAQFYRVVTVDKVKRSKRGAK